MSLVPPATWVAQHDRRNFGRDGDIEWRDDEETLTAEAKVGMRAARIQHEIIRLVGREMGRKGWKSWAAVAENAGLDIKPWQMNAIARGDAHLRLVHIAALDLHFGPLLLVGAEARKALDAQAMSARLAGEGISVGPDSSKR